ncbi:immunoglobulin alpha-2 heavy chain-like [Danio aesculapii]|uniref:immunoglobulin alpha-2 heavy chain-like n=1 Tax=Danio aesculapii TaxID=1142201 RepID=UPI0024BF7351|nr:immunoglobulin alpha-2 heavy chain-like [Danio aesculapii]
MSQTLLLLFAFFPYVSGISLTSSPAQTKAPGQSVRLSCQISGYALTDWGTAWIRHPPGKAMEWIGIIWGGGSIDSGNSFKSRFTISRDTGRNELYLDISSLQTEDTAVYYCARQPQWLSISGDEIRLDQSPAVTKSPRETVKISCKISGFIMTSSYMHWIRQKPGKALEWIGKVNTGSSSSSDYLIYADSIKNHFTMSEDVSQSTQYLEAKSLREEHTAIYYCAREPGHSDSI